MRFFDQTLFAFLTLFLSVACGGPEKKDNRTAGAIGSSLSPSQDASERALPEKKAVEKEGKALDAKKAQKTSTSKGEGTVPTQTNGIPQSPEGSGNPNPSPPGTPPTTGPSSTGGDGGGSGPPMGEQVFITKVLPVYKTMCVSCHADPRQPVEVRAPLSVYSYTAMRALLFIGAAPEDNGLWNRVRNLEPHTGGDRCQGGKNVSPCKEMIEWWISEKGQPAPGAQQLGRITDVSSLGRVYGYAFDPQDSNVFVQVNFYIDGPKGTGTPAGSTTANKPGDDGNQPGDHSFSFDLPEAYRNGKQRDIFAYAVLAGEEKPLSSVGFKYTAYAFTQAGRDFYNANVQGRLGGCGGCHTISYEQQFYSMIAPSPAKGGTATNNQLINKASQTNGASHGGGQSCANPNASPCSEFQRWWQVEFGTPPP